MFSNMLLAYVDPGSGGYLFQLLIAGVMALAATFTNFRGWVASLFKRGTSSKLDAPKVAGPPNQ